MRETAQGQVSVTGGTINQNISRAWGGSFNSWTRCVLEPWWNLINRLLASTVGMTEEIIKRDIARQVKEAARQRYLQF